MKMKMRMKMKTNHSFVMDAQATNLHGGQIMMSCICYEQYTIVHTQKAMDIFLSCSLLAYVERPNASLIMQSPLKYFLQYGFFNSEKAQASY